MCLECGKPWPVTERGEEAATVEAAPASPARAGGKPESCTGHRHGENMTLPAYRTPNSSES